MQNAIGSLYAGLPERMVVGSESTDHVATLARQRLRDSAYFVLRGVRCEFENGLLTLHGAVPSWHMKQVAQSLVNRLDCVDRIDNRLEVDPRR